MRTAITLSIGPDGKAKLAAGPEVPFEKQRNAFNDLRANGLPKGVDVVELWQSDGHRKRLHAAKLPPPPAPAKK